MTYQEVINEYFTFIWKMFQYDMSVFSQGWLYYWLLIPAMCYFAFYMVKWVVLTCPIWMPFSIIVSILKNAKNEKKEKIEKK